MTEYSVEWLPFERQPVDAQGRNVAQHTDWPGVYVPDSSGRREKLYVRETIDAAARTVRPTGRASLRDQAAERHGAG